MVVDAAVLRRLYSAAPEEFVAARDALVKELRAAKDRDTAAEVARLRRPSVPDWALNVVATAHPDAVNDLLDAATRLPRRPVGGHRGPGRRRRPRSAHRAAVAQPAGDGPRRRRRGGLGAGVGIAARRPDHPSGRGGGERRGRRAAPGRAPRLRSGRRGRPLRRTVRPGPTGRPPRTPFGAAPGRRTRRTGSGGDSPAEADRPAAPGAAPTTGPTQPRDAGSNGPSTRRGRLMRVRARP